MYVFVRVSVSVWYVSARARARVCVVCSSAYVHMCKCMYSGVEGRMWSPSGDFINVVNRSDFLGLGHFLERTLHSFIHVCMCKFTYMQVSVCICVLKPEVNLGYISSGATPN